MAPLELVQQKAERAKEQLRDLGSEVQAFADSEPYEVVPERNTHSGQILYRLASIKPIPAKIAHLSGEVIHTLRSTLDHLAYQLLLAANPNASEKERTGVYFPIYDPAKQTEAGVVRKIQPLGIHAIKAISAVKPYKGGNDLLWALHVLDNINKHRTLLTVGIVHHKIDVTDIVHALAERAFERKLPKPTNPMSVITPLTGAPAEVGAVLHVGFFIDEEINKKLKFPYGITLSESEIHTGGPLLERLQSMVNLIDNLLSDFAPLLK